MEKDKERERERERERKREREREGRRKTNIREKGRILLESEERSPGPSCEQCARVRIFYNMRVHGMEHACLCICAKGLEEKAHTTNGLLRMRV